MELINAQSEFAIEASIGQCSEDLLQMDSVREPNTVGRNLIETETEFGRPAAHDVQKLRIKEGLPSGEAKNAYSIGMGVLQEAHGHRDRQALRPFDRHTAVRAAQIALVGAGEGKVIGTKRSCTAAHRTLHSSSERRL